MWKRIALMGLLFAGLLLLAAGTDWAEENKAPKESPFRTPEHQYIGVKSCKMCHSKAKMGGEEYKVWAKTPHAKAFKTLQGDKAKAIAKEKGIADPSKAPECLKCHTVGLTADKKFQGPKLTQAEGVSCEACHGPGQKYKGMKTMKNRDASLAAGLVIPNETTCRSCHNEESPSFKEFDYKKMREKIKHWKDK